MVDSYPGLASQSVDAAAQHYAPIVLSDTVDLPYRPRGIWVGAGGTIVAVRDDGVAVAFAGTAPGSVLPIRPKRINATSTTAANLVALF